MGVGLVGEGTWEVGDEWGEAAAAGWGEIRRRRGLERREGRREEAKRVCSM